MLRINPWDEQYRRVGQRQEGRTLKAPGCPDFPITLRELDDLELGAVSDEVDRLEAKHITGRAGRQPLALALPDGSVAKLSRNTLYNVCTLQAQQVPEEGVLPYGFVELLAFARLKLWKPIYRQMISFSREMQGLTDGGDIEASDDEEDEQGEQQEPSSRGNDSAAATGQQ